MADLVFIRSKNKLKWPAKGLYWRATTGPYGKGRLSKGMYTVARAEVTRYTAKIKTPYQDSTGKGFFLPIYPQFKSSRSGLGIHPDGNVPGTEGCIGLSSNPGPGQAAPKKLHHALRTVPPGRNLTLHVK